MLNLRISERLFYGRSIAAASVVLLTAMSSIPLRASTITYNFAGATDIAISEGGNTIPMGTPFSGTLSYASPQAGAVSPFKGGTQSIFSYDMLTLTINGQTVTEPSGNLVLYDNVTSSTSGVPNGDSLYTFLPGTQPPASTGSVNGITPNFIYLGFVDSSATAFPGPGLPANLKLASFSQAFLGFNYGPLGTGDIDTIHPLNTLTLTVIPEPSTFALLGSALGLALLRVRSKRQSR